MAPNEKPPGDSWGLDGAGGGLYSRDAVRGVVKITEVEIGCQILPASLLGNFGRETYAQRTLNPSRGSQPLGAQREAVKREWHRETGKSRPQQGGSVSHRSARLDLGVFRSNPCRVHHQSSPWENVGC
jgi:hypothetical protein